MSNNVFKIRKNKRGDLVTYFKNISKYKYQNINELAEYLMYTSGMRNKNFGQIFIESFKYSLSLEENNNENIKINNLTIKMLIKYCEDNFIEEFLDKTEGLINNYDDVYQLAIDANKFRIVNKIFNKIKLTIEQINNIFSKILPFLNIDLDTANTKKTTKELLDKCTDIGMLPKEELVYDLLAKGIEINEIILVIYNVINDNNVKYIISKIKSGKIDFKKEKTIKYNFNDNEKESIKIAIFESIQHYNEKHLDTLSQMFDIKYDTKCLEILCKNLTGYIMNPNDPDMYCTEHKIFKYLINKNIKPDYDMVCKIIKKLKTEWQIRQYFKI